ncbi:MAG: YybH family protein [Candidatus Polarisedimenticolia bacterium]
MNVDREREALLKTDKEWAAAASTGDVDRIVSYWTNDAIVLPPGAPAIVGKQAIRAFVADSLKMPGFSITWQSEQAVIAAGHDMGYMVGTNKVTMPGADGRTVDMAGKAVTVWRKESDGAWRCVLDIWNAVPPAS